MPALSIGPYDAATDTIEIEGVKYAGALFRMLGGLAPSGILRILKRQDGIVTVERVYEMEASDDERS